MAMARAAKDSSDLAGPAGEGRGQTTDREGARRVWWPPAGRAWLYRGSVGRARWSSRPWREGRARFCAVSVASLQRKKKGILVFGQPFIPF